MKIYNGTQASQLATMSEHVATIRALTDELHDMRHTHDESLQDRHLSRIKVECYILREHLLDMIPTLTDEKRV